MDLPRICGERLSHTRGLSLEAMRVRKPSDEYRLTRLLNPSMYQAMAFSAGWRVCLAIKMMDQLQRRVAVHNGELQSLDCEAALQPVTRRPADAPPRVESKPDHEIEPALRLPDLGDVGTPFPNRLFGFEVPSGQVRGDRLGEDPTLTNA